MEYDDFFSISSFLLNSCLYQPFCYISCIPLFLSLTYSLTSFGPLYHNLSSSCVSVCSYLEPMISVSLCFLHTLTFLFSLLSSFFFLSIHLFFLTVSLSNPDPYFYFFYFLNLQSKQKIYKISRISALDGAIAANKRPLGCNYGKSDMVKCFLGCPWKEWKKCDALPYKPFYMRENQKYKSSHLN